MKEYEKLAKNYAKFTNDGYDLEASTFYDGVEFGFKAGFLKAREMACKNYESHDMFGYFLKYLKTMGEKDVPPTQD